MTSVLAALCFHALTTIKFSKPFVLITTLNAGRRVYSLPLWKPLSQLSHGPGRVRPSPLWRAPARTLPRRSFPPGAAVRAGTNSPSAHPDWYRWRHPLLTKLKCHWMEPWPLLMEPVKVPPWAGTSASWASQSGPLPPRFRPQARPKRSFEKVGRQTLQTQWQNCQAKAISSNRAAPEPPESLGPPIRPHCPVHRGPAAPTPYPRWRFQKTLCPTRSPRPACPRERLAAGKDSFPVLARRPQTHHRSLACSGEPRPRAASPDKSSESSASPHCPDTAARKSNAPNCRPGETRTRSSSDCSSCRWGAARRACRRGRPPPPLVARLFRAKQSQKFHRSGNRHAAAATCSRSDIPQRPSEFRHSAERSKSAMARLLS